MVKGHLELFRKFICLEMPPVPLRGHWDIHKNSGDSKNIARQHCQKNTNINKQANYRVDKPRWCGSQGCGVAGAPKVTISCREPDDPKI